MSYKLNMTEVDFEVQNHGSLFVLHPQNDAAREWIDIHVYGTDADGGTETVEQNVQWWGGGVVIEPRYLPDIIEGIEADGLDVKAV
jgi:hypothetical protein